MGPGIVTGFSSDRHFGQDRQIEAASISLFGLGGHLVHDSAELIEPTLQARILPPKRLHGGADDDLSRRGVGGGSDAAGTAGGQRRNGVNCRETAHCCQECSSIHWMVQ